MSEKNALDYLRRKYQKSFIELESVEKRYSARNGWEYYMYFKKDSVSHKEIISQHRTATL